MSQYCQVTQRLLGHSRRKYNLTKTFRYSSGAPIWPTPFMDVLRSNSREIYLHLPKADVPDPDRPFSTLRLNVQFLFFNRWSQWIPWPGALTPGTTYKYDGQPNFSFRFRLIGAYPGGTLSLPSLTVNASTPTDGKAFDKCGRINLVAMVMSISCIVFLKLPDCKCENETVKTIDDFQVALSWE